MTEKNIDDQSGILPGFEAFSYIKGSDTGILCLQGYTGSTSSIKPLAEFLVAKGYDAEGPRLSGHGTNWQDLNHVKYNQWVDDVEAGYKNIADRVKNIFVAGLSMGGLLALHLAQKHPEIKGIILINNVMIFKNPALAFLPILRLLVPSVEAISSDIHDPSQKETAYDRTPLNGLYEMMKILKQVKRNLPKILQPCVIFKSVQDHVVPYESAVYTWKHIGSIKKELIKLENSYHVATQDYEKDVIFKKSLEFIRENS